MDVNTLHCGDNLEIMRNMPDECVDLIYADPPFFTQKDWGDFDDRFDSMKHYIEFIQLRLVEMYQVLKPTGTLYLHCDHHASHRIRCAVDDVFGSNNFRDEIIWCYRGGGAPLYGFRKKHDTIYRYTKSDEFTFNMQYRPYLSNGPGFRGIESKNAHLGAIMDDWWDDIPSRSSATNSPEWLDYSTQKPEALLERIIKASSNINDIVLDPFNGSGTTVAVAKKLGRKYIGIDQNENAIKLTQDRLSKIPTYERLNEWI